MTTHSRQLLLGAAGRLFYEDGIAATGVDAVASAAGVTKPTLYAHFPSKSALVAATLAERHRLRAAELEAFLAGVTDPAGRPLAVFGWLRGWYAERGRRGCQFLNAAAELTSEQEPARAVILAEKQWLLELLRRLCTEAGLREPDRLASQLLLLVDGVAGRVVVQGPLAADGAVSDATDCARLLLAAAALRPVEAVAS